MNAKTRYNATRFFGPVCVAFFVLGSCLLLGALTRLSGFDDIGQSFVMVAAGFIVGVPTVINFFDLCDELKKEATDDNR